MKKTVCKINEVSETKETIFNIVSFFVVFAYVRRQKNISINLRNHAEKR